ncbi:hypothetical protein [Paenarthrobacter ureafaciens]|uniref:hypothetical protein n=1 Tax=Paenarthrobacter ureafaciens TaxID=37931 RepID=UPI001FB27F97|nr:hypothetical protein [Paenarthrobacter ureafaciens]UOD83342.1 hypothetical protein MQZ73_20315 [Paenarthrobacter ureafaciens]WNZ04327.1 hypothetical protein PVT25_01850 [Paenarthrobacter ureafaciens]
MSTQTTERPETTIQEQLRDTDYAQTKTIEHMLAQSRRTVGVQIRRDFVQTGTQSKPVPGALGKLVNTHNERALDLYLLQRLCAVTDPWDVKKPSKIWARALGLSTAGSNPNYASDTVSKLWGKLVDLDLIERTRESRMAKITTLHENAKGGPYTKPRPGKDSYFNLPLEYWSEDWYRKLSFAAKATLLITSSLQPQFYLPQEFGPKWYGVSADTLNKGLGELQAADLLDYGHFPREDWGTVSVTVMERRYTLQPPFTRKLSSKTADARFDKTLARWKKGGFSES